MLKVLKCGTRVLKCTLSREVTLDCFFDLQDVELTSFICTRYKFTLLLYFCFCTLTDCAPNFYQFYGDANDSPPDLAAAAAASFKMALATSSEEEKVVSLDGRAANGFDSCTR